MFEIVLGLVVNILANLATFTSLITGLFVIAALAITGTLPQAEYIKIVEFNPVTLRNRRRRLRLTQADPRDEATPSEPAPLPLPPAQHQEHQESQEPIVNQLNNFIVEPHQ